MEVVGTPKSYGFWSMACAASVTASANPPIAEWDCRTHAISRRYRYVIHNATTRDAFLAPFAWHYYQERLDAAAMQEALQMLL
ncbi:hypothetical protein CYMTET_30804, partial [Cymbomonas tetramitiformis]